MTIKKQYSIKLDCSDNKYFENNSNKTVIRCKYNHMSSDSLQSVVKWLACLLFKG